MALSTSTAWEIRPSTGLDTNGGGFVAGASGTDWSTANPAQYLLTNGQTQGTTVILTSSAAADMVGNIAYITGGTGSVVAAWYQIISVSVGVSITVDRSTGLTAGTGTTINIGGSLQTLPTVLLINTSGNKIFVKAEATITTTATITLSVAGPNPPSRAAPPTRLIGYTTTRTDKGRVAITLSTNTGLTALSCAVAGWWIDNFVIDCASLGTSTGISATGNYNRVNNCKVSNFTTIGIAATGASSLLIASEITAGTSAASEAVNIGAADCRYCYVHDNVCPGILGGSGGVIERNLIANNSGATSDGIIVATLVRIIKNTIYKSGRDGIRNTGLSILPDLVIRGNILAKNVWGINISGGTGLFADTQWDGNAFWSNSSGTRNNMDDVATNPIDAVSPYVNTLDVVISGTDPTNDPFTAKGSGDFTLNATAGAGALLRGTAPPASFPGATGTSNEDFGCFQSSGVATAAIFFAVRAT